MTAETSQHGSTGAGTEPRIILVTGTSRGIGRYLADHYLKLGDVVAGCSRTPSDLVHPRYSHTELDVLDETAVAALFARLRSVHGRLDALINNAGIGSMNHTMLTPITRAREVMETNFLGTFLLCREAAKLMQRAGWGRIVNFTSAAVPLNLAGEAVYAASKAAVESFTRVLARETADWGITVNAVGPAPTRTALLQGVPDETLAALIERQAIRRFCDFEDIANVVDFFLKPESDFVTGQTLYLGGV